jgi:hypothetical protein
LEGPRARAQDHDVDVYVEGCFFCFHQRYIIAISNSKSN